MVVICNIPPMTRNGSGNTSSSRPVCRCPKMCGVMSGIMVCWASWQSRKFGLKPKCLPLHLMSKAAFRDDDMFNSDARF